MAPFRFVVSSGDYNFSCFRPSKKKKLDAAVELKSSSGESADGADQSDVSNVSEDHALVAAVAADLAPEEAVIAQPSDDELDALFDLVAPAGPVAAAGAVDPAPLLPADAGLDAVLAAKPAWDVGIDFADVNTTGKTK